MKFYSLLAGISTATIAMSFTQSFAQDSQSQSVILLSQDEPEEEAQPRLKLSDVTFGVTSFKGNRAINHYASPIDGFGLHSLRFLSPLTETSPFFRFIVRGMPDQDNLIEGYSALNHGNTVVRASRTQYGRSVIDWRPRLASAHNEVNVTVDHAISDNVGGFLTYQTKERNTNYAAPRGPDQTQTQTVGGGFGGNLLGGNFGLSFNDRRTYTGTGVQPTTLQRGFNANYSRDLTDNLSVLGMAAFSRIEQAGQPSGDIRSYKLNGLWNVDPQTGVQFQFARQDSDIDSVLNAYVRKRLVTNARLIHRLPGWTVQFAYNHKESERVRADHLFVDVPKSDGYEVRLSGNVGAARMKLRGSWERISNDAVMNTNDPRRLYWGDRATYQAKFEGGSETYTAYGVYTYRINQNDDRGVEIGWNNFALGGSYIISPELYGYAEIAIDDFRVVGVAGTGQSLDFYFPNARTLAIGADWAKSPELSASANLNFYESGNVRGTQLTFSLRRSLSPDNELELIVAPWNRDDREFDLTSFHSTFFSARFTTRF